jgi:hypothetical protein
MRCRVKQARTGQILSVMDSTHYPLPFGLKEGDLVKLVEFDHGYWKVEREGQRFIVYCTALGCSFEYEWRDRWLPSTDARVRAELKRTSLDKSKPYPVLTSAIAYPWMK